MLCNRFGLIRRTTRIPGPDTIRKLRNVLPIGPLANERRLVSRDSPPLLIIETFLLRAFKGG
jgi:hypothetical protein